MQDDPGPFRSSLVNLIGDQQPLDEVFHPMKGPMTTQSLRGMDNHGPVLTCASCHKLDPDVNPGAFAPGNFGTDGFSSFAFNFQLFKVPHLRNLYQKVGMFGNPLSPGFLSQDDAFKGDQVRGFGFLHDGAADTLFRFHTGISFSEIFTGPGNGGFPVGPEGDVQRRDLEQFLLAFPSNLAPVVGQQITLASASQAALARVELLRQRAEAGECDLVAKARLFGSEVGFLYVGGGHFASDRQALPLTDQATLKHLATAWGRPVTYTCAPPGSGERVGLDRDEDGFRDGDERDAGSDPADASSTP